MLRARTHALTRARCSLARRRYTEAVLRWWRHNNPAFPTWAKAARVVFAMAPSSAASERVFSLVNQMFNPQQITALADFIQGSLMLRYNQRQVG